MRRILITGPPGSGKTTLAGQLSQVLNIPAYHLDGLYWNAGWAPKSMGEKQELLRSVLAQDSWIIDGYYAETMEMRLQAADTLILLALPPAVCVARVIRRKLRREIRDDLRPDCPDKLDLEFLQFTWSWSRKQLQELLGLSRRYAASVDTLVLRRPKDAAHLMEKVRPWKEDRFC